ncbi:PAP2 superfamily protein [Pontibacter ummariensis]|uniref:PAP2 superfamily protein n=1 Tax=Pontibacter ummariensis TaxID=1610492 RepID=A0A239AWX8_9BACT|nr:vanadium-dependent haloperoxidase [Pontibacter ummariensis]PRY16161.1 PAP2 superfamily protein [Pontibacter ummariensis]SNS00195.1 PAP2 superfamily protein [Pontibacter ummariensis]
MKKLLSFLLILTVVTACRQKQEPELHFSSKQINQVLAEMTDIMVHDVTNPPLAARFFSYACLAGYEVVSQHDSAVQSMHGVLNDYPLIQKPADLSAYSYQLSALLAMMETAKKMQPSGSLLEAYQQEFLDSCRSAGVSEQVLRNSVKYAQEISGQILAYAKADNYNRISNYPRYSPTEEEGAWYPTPPGFFAPVEPYFNTVRPFTLDTCSQFKPAPPVAFSLEKGSSFYKLLQEVYEEGKDLSAEHQQIAAFWDCNPFALQENGHLMVGMKKISPGAHWMGITGIACEKAKLDFPEAMKVNTMVSVALMDGFIACWDEKFRSNRIRPETAIRQHLDPSWKPLLQTPPFPEYLSGHSTISSAAAVVLTHYFGDNFQYTDTVEERFGLPSRQFTSFQQAAEEAGVSRLYGGIHFMDAVDNGRTQGLQVGEWVLQKVEKEAVKTRIVAQAK